MRTIDGSPVRYFRRQVADGVLDELRGRGLQPMAAPEGPEGKAAIYGVVPAQHSAVNAYQALATESSTAAVAVVGNHVLAAPEAPGRVVAMVPRSDEASSVGDVPRPAPCGKPRAVNDAGDFDEMEGKVSYAEVLDAWYVVCTSDELGRSKPLSRKLFRLPLVVFRGPGGEAGVLLDRCAHRNVPLSRGRIVDCQVECPYHGWRYDAEGDCRKIPGLLGRTELPRRAVPRYVAREQDGYVWIWGNPETEPQGAPYRPPKLDDPRYHTARKVVSAKGTLHAVVENALDVPHTAFLHKGLFRGTGTTNEIKAVVTRDDSSVTCEYIGEPRPEGVVGRILSPSGGVVTHFDRFIMPSVAQVEYAIGDENHILITSICTPEEPFFTRMYAVVTWRMRFPAPVVRAVLDPVASSIFAQDAKMLDVQTKHVTRFGGERYTSTEIDLLGPQIWRLLKRAAEGRGPRADEGEYRREVRLEA